MNRGFEIPGKWKTPVQGVLLLLSALMLWYGVDRGEVQVVLNKAINICLECVGLG